MFGPTADSKNQPRRMAALVACFGLTACASTVTAPPPGTIMMPLTDGLEAITDVEGPYGAVRYGDHAVAVRVWPDSLDDGLAELSVIVTNGGWNTVVLDAGRIQLVHDDRTAAVLGKSEMLAQLDAQSDSVVTGTAGRRPEQSGPNEATATTSVPQGSMARGPQNNGFGSVTADPALASAARQAGASRRPSGLTADRSAQRASVEDWYLDVIEIYPGDTAAGGISIAVPREDADLELRVNLGNEQYAFPLRYRTRQ